MSCVSYFWFFSPTWATFQHFTKDIPTASLTGQCRVIYEGHLSKLLVFLNRLHFSHTPVDSKVQEKLLIKVTRRRVGLDAKKGWKRNTGLEKLRLFNCSLVSTSPMTQMDRALLSWNSQSIGQWIKGACHVLIWCNRCQYVGNQDAMGALKNNNTPTQGRAENQTGLCRGSSVLTGTWSIVAYSRGGGKRVQGHVPRPEGERKK